MVDKYRIFVDMEAEVSLNYIKTYPEYFQPDVIRIMNGCCQNKDTLKEINKYKRFMNRREIICDCGQHLAFQNIERHRSAKPHIMFSIRESDHLK